MMAEQGSRGSNGRIVVHGDPVLRQLIPGFLDNRRNDVTTILAALAREDFQTIQVLGHRMKGDGGGYGFAGISAIGRMVEQAAKDKSASGIRDAVAELSSYLDRVEVVYDAS